MIDSVFLYIVPFNFRTIWALADPMTYIIQNDRSLADQDGENVGNTQQMAMVTPKMYE